MRLLENIPGISVCHFNDADVVRHPLVQKIIVAYEQRDAERRAALATERTGASAPPAEEG